MKNKPKLAIITEGLRRDNQKPLRYFYKIKVLHFYYNAPYGHETQKDLKGAIKFNGFWDLHKRLVKAKPDIIQGTEPYGSRNMFLFSIASYLAAKKLHIPLIFPFWENRPSEERFGFLKRFLVNWFTKIYINYATLVIYINNGALKNIKKLGIQDQSKLVKFIWGTWGVDIDEFKPSKSPVKDKVKQNIILFVGRIVKEKGIKYLLQAFLKIQKRLPNTKLLIIGSGDLKEYVSRFRTKERLEDKIILKKPVNNEDLPTYFQNATIFCSPAITLPKWAEQVGMTNIQAMACGTPIVSTTSGGIPEYVPNKVAGFLVPERDPDRLASAIIRLLDDDKLRERISAQCVEYARKNYDAQKNIHKAQDIILNILKNAQDK